MSLSNLLKAEKAKGFPGGKEAFLRKAAQIPGTYCPALYDVEYTEQGDFKSITPRYEDVPATIQKRIIEDVEHVFFPTKPVVPFLDIVHDRAVLELFRGCTRGCRFCQAGMLYRPVRERTPERLLEIAKETIANTGYNEISLMSLSSADYSKLPELVDMLMEEFKDKQVSVSYHHCVSIVSLLISLRRYNKCVRVALPLHQKQVLNACAMLSIKVLVKKIC